MSTTSISHAAIRPASAADLSSVHALLRASSLPTVGVEGDLDGFFVAESGTEVVGVIGLETCCREYALLRSAAVADSWRSRGVGRRLVERAIAEAEARGYDALYLLTTTAERYFPSFGFTTVPRAEVPEQVKATEQFRESCPASATVMAKPLHP